MAEPNLSRGERKATEELKKNRKIVIKLAGKGNAVIIMDRDQYLWEGQRQLAVAQHYCPMSELFTHK